MPRLIRKRNTGRRAKPEREPAGLPHVEINWSKKELRCLAKLLNSTPAKPTEALIRAAKASG